MLCLCRVLLAALAVSCTLSRINANGPSTQRLDRLKDLMCVLLLSGMQKDDLDANVLNKLQRHNVNIHDMNNKELLEECTTLQELNNNNRTTQTNTNENIKTSINMTPIKHNITNDAENNNNNTKYEDKYNEDRVKYVDGQPELKSVLNFWRDMNNYNSTKTTEPPMKSNDANDITNKYRSEPKNKRNVPDASNSNESEIQKILANLLAKSRNKNTNKPVNKKSIDVKDLYSNSFLGPRNDKGNTGINDNDNTAIAPGGMALLNEMPIRQYAPMNNPSQDDWQLNKPQRVSERDRNRPINLKNFNDIFSRLQTYYPIKSKDISIDTSNENKRENMNLKQFTDHQKITTEKLITPKITEPNISQNIIKEIANSVKELILRDLKKEILQTTTSSTTEKISTTLFTTEREKVVPTVTIEKHVEQTILSKFMDLFEEIKTLKHKTLIISGENKKEVHKEEKTYNTYPKLLLPIINNGVVNTKTNYKAKLQYPNSNTQKIFNFSPQIHKFRSNSVSEPIIQPNQQLPITFQTNNMEIPPLGIPVSDPENPINQNIIVPTTRPYRISNNRVDFKIKSPDSRAHTGTKKKSEIRILKSHEPSHYDPNHQIDKRLTVINNNPNLDERFSFNRFKQTIHRDGIKRGSQPRFHEKLERAREYYNSPKPEYTERIDCCDERYAYSKQMVECCNRKIASRQQMSLNPAKKHSSYDESHFNNFLKSQKKVTDMLERILTSRGRVHSVEIV